MLRVDFNPSFFIIMQAKLSILHSGWKMLMIANDNSVSVLRIEAKGQQNNIRVRQLQVLGYPDRYLEASLPAVLAQRKACEAEALRVFRLLTSEVRSTLANNSPWFMHNHATYLKCQC